MSKRVTLTDIEVEYILTCIRTSEDGNRKNNNGGLYVIARENLLALKTKLEFNGDSSNEE